MSKFKRTVQLIYPRHCTPISIRIGQHLLKLCTKVFWCVFYVALRSMLLNNSVQWGCSAPLSAADSTNTMHIVLLLIR